MTARPRRGSTTSPPTPEPAAGRTRDPLLPAIVGVALLLRVALLARPMVWIDDALLPDDAYLSFTLARNLARGLGPWYGLAPTNGFQPLYVLLASVGWRLLPHDPGLPVRLALGLLIACDLVTVMLLHRAARTLAGDVRAGRAAALLWAVSPVAIAVALNGLETALAGMLLLAAVAWHVERFARRPAAAWRARDALALGALVGLAGFARADGLLVAPAMAVAAAPAWRRAGLSGGRVASLAGAATAGVLALTLPWAIWFATATGHVFPVSGAAVRELAMSAVDHHPTLGNLYLPMLRRALDALVRVIALPVLTAAGALALLTLRRRPGLARATFDSLQPLAAFALLAAVLFVAYATLVFGPWYFPRYFAPIGLLATVVAAVLLARATVGAPRWRMAVLAVVVIASALHPAARRLANPRAPHAGYGRVGRWVRDHFPPGTVVGGSQTGGIGYVADSLVVINLDGVVNAAALDAMHRRDLAGYMRGAGVRWLVWQDDIAMIARASTALSSDALTPVDTLPDVSTGHVAWTVWRFDPH